MLKIALDVMGGDLAPVEPIRAVPLILREYGDVSLYLLGPEENVRKGLIAQRLSSEELERVEIVDAPETVEMGEKPTEALKGKRRSSVALGMGLVREGKAQAFVSAGDTGVVFAFATFHLGRIENVVRPAICVELPTLCEEPVVFLDAGANADARPEMLYQFGVMGKAYAQTILGRENPKVALLNIGEEETKGSSLYKNAHAILKERLGGFVGNREGKDILTGDVDVIVADGFTGNVVIKTLEGAVSAVKELLTRAVKGGGMFAKLGGLAIKGALKREFSKFDWKEYGGAVLVGVKGVVVIAHGRSDAVAIKNAVGCARKAVVGKMVERIGEALKGGTKR